MRSSKRSSAPGLKLLMTTGALAATLGGWAVLTLGDAQQVAQAAPPPAVVISVNQPVSGSSVVPETVPTLRVVTVPPDTMGPRSPAARTQSSR